MTGLLDIAANAYHLDAIDTDRPSLSKSILHTLIEKSPAHAFAAHPRLNPNFQRQDDEKFDLGNAAHSLFLEGIDSVAICPYDSWRTKAAKDERAEVRALGRIPMLQANYDECVQMVDAIRRQLGSFDLDPPLFAEAGTCEQTLVWEDDYGVLCRGRIDWLHDDLSAIDDLKTTRASANPEAWSRTMFGMGAHLQQAFYLRGMEKVLGLRAVDQFRFVVVETQAPYAMSVVTLAPDALALAEKQVDYGLRLWATCLRNNRWPSYPAKVAYASAPPWMEAQWLERELRELAA